ncbi:hypothetical protein CU669_05330 [Paramagnetospirillum kuznetsovii]|uniref:Lipoprotein n=1 Tax=Paramagnetospirillum kuznetsovii TaxID=2053833 RepID=A0A364P0E7_9PROT|nr:hypothetical protein [Paramagnetospirillum kuznetsovii]RAU22811.1 hypothetical protein CU669_05330 [Paramagnetospirillum kuznetsovii]
MRRLLILGLVVLTAVPLAGCGRKGNPEEPEDAVYPRTYPYIPQPEGAKKKSSPPASGSSDYQPPQPRMTTPPTNVTPPDAESR